MISLCPEVSSSAISGKLVKMHRYGPEVIKLLHVINSFENEACPCHE